MCNMDTVLEVLANNFILLGSNKRCLVNQAKCFLISAPMYTPYSVFFTLPTAWIHTAKERAVN